MNQCSYFLNIIELKWVNLYFLLYKSSLWLQEINKLQLQFKNTLIFGVRQNTVAITGSRRRGRPFHTDCPPRSSSPPRRRAEPRPRRRRAHPVRGRTAPGSSRCSADAGRRRLAPRGRSSAARSSPSARPPREFATPAASSDQFLHIKTSFFRNFIPSLGWLVAWHSGRTSVFSRRTFPVLRSTCS